MKLIQKLFLISAVAVVMALILASCSTIKNELGLSDKAGVTYNKLTVSESEIDSDLKAIANNKALAKSLAGATDPLVKDGEVTPTYRASWANIKMRTLSIREIRVKHHEKITKADKKSAETDAKNLFAGSATTDTDAIWKGFPKSFQDRLVTDLAEQYSLLRAAPKVTDAEIKKYYDANQATISPACASGKSISHILVKTKKEADAIKADITAGQDFAKLAKAKSTDPGSKDSGGNLGCYVPGSYVAEFEAVASTLPIGSVSDVVKTQFGYHILKATAYAAPPLDQVKDQIRTTLAPTKQTKLYNEIQAALKKAKVKVLSKYGRVVVQDGAPTIVPLAKDTPATTAPADTVPADTTPADAASTTAPTS